MSLSFFVVVIVVSVKAQNCSISMEKLCVWVLVAQLCPALCDRMDCSPPGFSVPGILQARTLEWIAMPSFRGPSQHREWTQVSCIASWFFTIWVYYRSSKHTCFRLRGLLVPHIETCQSSLVFSPCLSCKTNWLTYLQHRFWLLDFLLDVNRYFFKQHFSYMWLWMHRKLQNMSPPTLGQIWM